MKTDLLSIGLSLVAGGLAYDKFANGGKVTNKVVSAVGNSSGGFVKTIEKTVKGGTNTIRETVTNTTKIIKDTAKNVGAVGGTVKNTLDLTHGLTSSVNNGKNILSKILNVGAVSSSPLTHNNNNIVVQKSNFDKNGGVFGKISDYIGFPVFFSGVNNAKNFITAPLTGQKVKTFNTVYGTQTYLTNKKNTKPTSSSGYKSSKSSSGSSSSSRVKYVTSPSKVVKYVGSHSYNNVVIKSSNGKIKGSYNNKRRQSLTPEATISQLKVKDNPIVKLFEGL